MHLPTLLAKHFREVYFGGNWTWVNLKDTLSDVSWEQAITKIEDCNTIAALVYHIHYYVGGVSQVLAGGTLDIHDKYSFAVSPLHSQAEWENRLATIWTEAETYIQRVEAVPESQLNDIFSQEKYGNYFRNLQGIIEHTHYHLGQIVIIKKMVQQLEKIKE